MKKFIALAVAATAAVVALAPANAAQGCGPGWHRGPMGHCHPDGGPGVVVVPSGPIIGSYYEGHGYWDGHNYYMHRERWHRGWRYR